MSTFSYVAFGGFATMTVVMLVMLKRLPGMFLTAEAEEPRPLTSFERTLKASTMIALIGAWELSVALVIVSTGELSSATGPGLMGVGMVSSRLWAPAMARRLG